MNSRLKKVFATKKIIASMIVDDLASKLKEDIQMAELIVKNVSVDVEMYDEVEVHIDFSFDLSDSPAHDDYLSLDLSGKNSVVEKLSNDHKSDIEESFGHHITSDSVGQQLNNNGFEKISKELGEQISVTLSEFKVSGETNIDFRASFFLPDEESEQ